MMKRIALLIIAGLGLALAVRGLAPHGGGGESKLKLSRFEATLELPVSFEYPEGWKLKEEKGTVQNYRQARIMGPRNEDDTYSASISVVGYPLRKDGGRFDDLAGMIRNFKEHQIGEEKMEQEKMTVVGGQPAVDMTISTVIPPLLHRGTKNLEVPVKNRTLFVQRGESLYRITYSADSRMYDSHSKEFEHLLGSLQFR